MDHFRLFMTSTSLYIKRFFPKSSIPSLSPKNSVSSAKKKPQTKQQLSSTLSRRSFDTLTHMYRTNEELAKKKTTKERRRAKRGQSALHTASHICPPRRDEDDTRIIICIINVCTCAAHENNICIHIHVIIHAARSRLKYSRCACRLFPSKKCI